MHTSVFFASLLAILAAANPIVERNAVGVGAGFALITTDTQNLDTAVTDFSVTDGTLDQVLAIQNDVTTLDNSLTKTTTDVQNSNNFTEVDANNVLGNLQTLEPVLLDTLTQFVNKKPGFDRLNSSSNILNYLTIFRNNHLNLELALINVIPVDSLPQFTPIINTVNAAIDSAVAAYS